MHRWYRQSWSFCLQSLIFPLNTLLVLLLGWGRGERAIEQGRCSDTPCTTSPHPVPSLLRFSASSMSPKLLQHPAEDEKVTHAQEGPWPSLRLLLRLPLHPAYDSAETSDFSWLTGRLLASWPPRPGRRLDHTSLLENLGFSKSD